MFIDLIAGEIDLGAGRDDQRELHLLRARAPRLKKDALNAGENQFAHRASVCGRLRLEPAVERRRDIDRGANAVLLHKGYYPMCAINMEPRFFAPAKAVKNGAREESELDLSESHYGD